MSSQDSQRRTAAIFWSLLIGGLALRLIFFAGPIGSDDSNYYMYSEQLLNGRLEGSAHHHASRMLFMLLLGIPTVLSHSLYTGCMLSIAVSIAGGLLVYAFMRRHASMNAALVAFGMVMLSGTSILYASVFVPDNLTAVLMPGAAMAIFHAIETPRRRGVWLIGAGVLTGLAYSSKDTALLMLPPLVLWILIGMRDVGLLRRLQAAALYGLAMLAVYLAESAAYWWVADDFFYRSHALTQVHNRTIEASTGALEFAKAGYWALLTLLVDWARNGPMLVLGALGALGVLLWNRPLAGFVLTGLFVTLYLIVGSSSLTRLVHLPIQDRYLLPCIPFAAIALGLALDAVGRRWPGRFDITGAATIPLLIALLATGVKSAAAEAGSITFADYYRNAADAIRILSANGRPIHVDSVLHHHLRHMLPPELHRQLVVFDEMPSLAPGYYMIVPMLLPESHASKETQMQLERMSPALPALIASIVTQPVVMRITTSHFDAGRYSATARDQPLMRAYKAAIVHAVGP